MDITVMIGPKGISGTAKEGASEASTGDERLVPKVGLLPPENIE